MTSTSSTPRMNQTFTATTPAASAARISQKTSGESCRVPEPSARPSAVRLSLKNSDAPVEQIQVMI